jgi:uncharacterized protein YegL
MRWLFCFLILFACPAMAADNLVVVLDNSGSMKSNFGGFGGNHRITAAKTTLHAELRKVKPDSKVGIVILNPTAWVVPLAKINQDTIHPIIDAVVAEGGTPLGSAMKLGADALLDLRKKEKYGTYRLLVITDGEASPATEAALVTQYTPDIVSRGITLDVIGLNLNNHALSKNVHSFKSADDQAALNKEVAKIFAETTVGTDTGTEYELLAALPDGMADKLIDTMVTTTDVPIGAPRVITIKDEQGNIIVPAAAPKVEESGTLSAMILIYVFVGILVVIMLICMSQNNFGW